MAPDYTQFYPQSQQKIEPAFVDVLGSPTPAVLPYLAQMWKVAISLPPVATGKRLGTGTLRRHDGYSLDNVHTHPLC